MCRLLNSFEFKEAQARTRCLELGFAQKGRGWNYPLYNKYRCLNSWNNFGVNNPKIAKCLETEKNPDSNAIKQKRYNRLPTNSMEKCLEDYEAGWELGFVPNPYMTLAYSYQRIKPIEKRDIPAIMANKFTTTDVQNYLCK